MLKRLKRLFKPCVTLRFYDEGNKTIIEHDLKSINARTLTKTEAVVSTILANARFYDSVEIRTRG